MQKKGQITLFIIVGIIIIIAMSFFLYFRNILLPEAEVVPEDIKPIKNYVESCLSNIGEEAVVLLGSRSGFIKIPDAIELSEAYIEFIPNSELKIPYWYYNGLSYIPTIESMQDDISIYIKDNINNCIDLDDFKGDFYIEEKNNTKVETIISNDGVDLAMTYEMIITSKSDAEQTKVSKFHTVLPVKLKESYELGKKILEAENANTYFENITIDWISMNPDIPLNGIMFSCSDLKWRVSSIKEKIQETVYYNLPRIMVKDTDHPSFLADDSVYEKLKEYTLEDINQGNYPEIETPSDAYDYSHYLLDVRTKKTNLKAGFFYNPVWGMDLTARPSEDGIMKSIKQEGSDEFLRFMCLNVYHFNYDIIYPIEVLINDETAFNRKGYVFRFGFTVMINHNEPDREGFFNPEFIMLGTSSIGECDQLEGDTYDIRTFGVDQFGIANTEIKDVNITYDCYKFKCSLGSTKADQGSYRLRTKLPGSCANGFIVAEKPGYLISKQQVLDSTDIDMQMKKIKTLYFGVVSNTYNTLNRQIGEDIPINKPFSVSIDVQSIDDPSFHYSKRYPFDETNKDMTLELIEQNSQYKLDLSLFDEADGVLIGGYQGNWSIRYDDVATSNKVIFHAASYLPKPLNALEEQNVFTFLEENNIYKDRLKPELVR